LVQSLRLRRARRSDIREIQLKEVDWIRAEAVPAQGVERDEDKLPIVRRAGIHPTATFGRSMRAEGRDI